METSRVPINSKILPGVTSEKDWPEGEVKGEQERCAIYDRNGEYVGSVVYVKRRRKLSAPVTHPDGFVQTHETTFGWRPVKNPPQVKLTDKIGAVLRLPKLAMVAGERDQCD